MSINKRGCVRWAMWLLMLALPPMTSGCEGEDHSFLSKRDFDEKYNRGESDAVDASAADNGSDDTSADDAMDDDTDDDTDDDIDPASMDAAADSMPAADAGLVADAGSAPTDGGMHSMCADAIADAGPACRAPREDCTNGVDDNDNGLIDCADPTCRAGYRCVPPAPADWSPLIALASADGAEAPACAGAYADVERAGLHRTPRADPLDCSCECSAPAGASCKLEPVYYEGTECQGIPWRLAEQSWFDSGSCGEVLIPVEVGAPGAESVELIAHPSVEQGNCSTTVDESPPINWETNAQGCAAPTTVGGGCAVGACLPNPPKDMLGLCVYRDGDRACPAGFPTKELYYTGADDMRACDCTCNVTCSPVSTHTATACTDDPEAPAVSVVADGTCTPIPVDPSPSATYNCQGSLCYNETRSLDIPDASCPGMAQTSGSVSQSAPLTVCCQ